MDGTEAWRDRALRLEADANRIIVGQERAVRLLLIATFARGHVLVVPAIPDDATGLPALLAERAPRGSPVAYVCEGRVCDAPIIGFDAFQAKLAAGEIAPRSQVA